MEHNPSGERLTDGQRAALLASVCGLAGASLQKLWLVSPELAILHFRLPGRSVLVALDARSPMAALLEERPRSQQAPRAQATLRKALLSATLTLARLERERGASPRDPPIVRLAFDSPGGRRALVALPRGPGLALLAALAGGGERVLWLSSPAGELRAGAPFPAVEQVVIAAGAQAAETAGIAARALRSEGARAFERRKRELLRSLREREQKLRRTREAVLADAARARAAVEQGRMAQLLLPVQGRVMRGAREARVPDWSQLDEKGRPRELVLTLDPALSASENAARLLARARRYAAAESRIAARAEDLAREISSAEQMLAQAEAVQDAAALEEIARSLPARPPSGRARAGRPSPRRPFRAFRGPSGARILVGRSARDNDALTFAAARGNDLWLHARGAQGSHVVVPDPGPAPSSATLLEAALLAAHFSSMRGAEHVEVAWTRRKYVRKPRGAPSGAVTCSQDRTLRLRQDPGLLARLLAGEEP